jgi:hypothetical protein
VFTVEKYKITVGGKAALLACLSVKMEEMLFFERFVTIYRSQRGKTRILELSRKPVFEGKLYWINGQEDTIHRP